MDVVNNLPGLASIRFLTGPLAGSVYPISKPEITIGREPTNDIAVSDPSVSRHHARLVYAGGQWSVEKLSPQNVVTVNSQNVQRAIISDRDTIGLGAGTTFQFLTTPAPSSAAAYPPTPSSQQQAIRPNPAVPQQAAPAPVPPYGGQQGFATEGASFGTQRIPGASAAPGVPSLEVSSNVHSDKQVVPLTKQVINIGRDPSNDVVVNELVVSGFHAQIVREGNQLVLIHPHPARGKTLNGLLYQGRHIRGDQQFRKPLARGDIFRIGDEHGTLVTLAFNDGSGATQDIVPEIRPIPLGAPVITLGRAPDNMVVLQHPQVSGHHARLEQVAGGYRIVDLGSTNHSYVNGQRVTNQVLRPGDEIRIGPYKLTFTGTELTQHDESGGIRIDALQLRKVGNNHTVLINDISIAIPPRKFVALVGGSGAGKSTLMDALNGLRPAQEGAVLYNGQDYYHHLAAFSTQLGYVPQDDIVHRDLTVERALYYTAKMRLPDDFTEEQIQQRITEVLEDVEMKHRRNLLVSKLSGGQRKRVSIALELLANPSVFFLDEPTSGLDPGLDRKMMFLLRKLADKGHTIVLVTHATNNINTCDYVCFLSQGGHLAYYGPPEEAKTYFGKTDFAEIYSALEPTDDDQDIPAKAEAKFRNSPDFQKYVDLPLRQGPAAQVTPEQPTGAITLPRRGNARKQFWLLCRRYLELLWNDRGNFLILILQAPIIGLILMFLTSSLTFKPSSIVTCPLRAPVPDTVGNNSSCQNYVNFFNTQQGQFFMQERGYTSVNDAVQHFIQPLSGGDAQKTLFIIAFAAVMFGCINGAREIVKEAAIYKRERTVNLGIAAYMFSKIAVLGTLCLIQSAVLVLMVNAKAPFQTSIFLPPILEIYITAALTALAGLMIGLTISAIAPNNDRAMSFVPIILIPQVIFSGIIFALNNAGLQFLGSFFAARWAMAAMGSTVGLHEDVLGNPNDWAYVGALYSTNSQAEAVVHLLLMWLALIAMIVLLGILMAYFLKRKDARV